MSSAERQIRAEVRAQQLLTTATSIRGRAREVLPQTVHAVGATTFDLATAFRHEPTGQPDRASDTGIMCQVRRHADPPLLEHWSPTDASDRQREPWYTALIDLLVNHGANRTTAVAAVDRLADLLTETSAGRWEWAARRDPILNRLGLTPNQCGALVALLGGGRSHRHNGRTDSLLRATRTTKQPGAVALSRLQQRRVASFTGHIT